MQRSSLLDDLEFGPRESAPPTDPGRVFKACLASVLFLLAAGLFSWQVGLFDRAHATEVSPELSASRAGLMEVQEEELERLLRDGEVSISGP